MSVPVIVVGNIAVGGTGKTPLTIALVEKLQRAGFRPGVISRGYGGKAHDTPIRVTEATASDVAGDEPVLIARRTGVPLFVHRRRVTAARALLKAASVDVVVCDDGLQHYALARDVEIVVIDGARGLGNRRMLPAGPLREPPRRLQSVDHVVMNGDGPEPDLPAGVTVTRMSLQPTALVNVKTGERRPVSALVDKDCVAVAGIGNPQRFFSLLGELGYDAECRAFPDHHPFKADDLAFVADRPVLMTEKDAVKCVLFATDDWWYLEVSAGLDDDSFFAALAQQIASVGHNITE